MRTAPAQSPPSRRPPLEHGSLNRGEPRSRIPIARPPLRMGTSTIMAGSRAGCCIGSPLLRSGCFEFARGVASLRSNSAARCISALIFQICTSRNSRATTHSSLARTSTSGRQSPPECDRAAHWGLRHRHQRHRRRHERQSLYLVRPCRDLQHEDPDRHQHLPRRATAQTGNRRVPDRRSTNLREPDGEKVPISPILSRYIPRQSARGVDLPRLCG